MKAHRRQRGFAILAVVFILVMFTLLGMAAVSLIAGSAAMLLDEVKSQQAFDLANAGLAYEAEQLEGDSDWSDNTDYTKTFGPGSFAVTYISQAVAQATVRVDGAVGGVTRSVQQDFQAGPGLKAFTVATYSEGNMRARNNGNIDVDGDSSLGGVIQEWGSGNVDISGSNEENNPSAEVPTPSAAYWLSVADHVITGNYRFLSGAYNGIWYVTGNARVQSSDNVTINGTLAVVGNVIFRDSSNTAITAGSGSPAIVCGGRVLVRDQAQLDVFGWIVTMDRFQVRGTGDVDVVGGITAEDRILVQNSGDISVVYDENRAPSTAGFIGGETTTVIQRSNWEEVL